MSDANTQLFQADYLKHFCSAVFRHFGVPAADAELAADVLAKSDLRGIDSHGLARLHTYFEMLELGRINPKPQIKIIREKASVATVDGDNGLGLVVGPKANEIAMDKAEQHGSGWVSVYPPSVLIWWSRRHAGPRLPWAVRPSSRPNSTVWSRSVVW